MGQTISAPMENGRTVNDMRLINAIAYRRVLEEEKDYQLEHCKDSFKCRCGLEIAIADLGDMPTIDAVEVVRCKDCVNGKPCRDGYVLCSHPAGKRLLMTSSDFCSYGKRKENNDGKTDN